MDITQLRYFLKTAETLNYTRAAEGLFITRQSLRQALSNLEGEIGAPLFENEKNHLSLTEYGEYLAFSATDVVGRFDAMAADMARLVEEKATLRVAFSVSLLTFLLNGVEGVFKAFQAKFPHLHLEVLNLPADQVVDAALAGEIDCGCVLQMPCSRPGCSVQVLREYPAAVDFGDQMPLYGRESVTPRDLAGVPLVGMGSLEKIAVPLWEDCRREGIELSYQTMPNAIDAFYHMQHSLAAGLDVYYTPAEADIPHLRSARLTGYTWELALLCPEQSPRRGMARLFCRFLEEQLSTWQNEA